jgi:hypothetical protein
VKPKPGIKKTRRRDQLTPENRRSSGVSKLRGGLDPAIGKLTQFKPGESPNPGGRPKSDLAGEIARAVFQQNPEAIYDVMLEALKEGDPRVFAILAERGYGKVRQDVLIEGDMQPLNVHVHFVDANDGQPKPRKAVLKLPEPQEDDF